MMRYASILFLGLIFCGQSWGAGVTDWWDSNYSYRKLISCGNHDEYSTDDFLHVSGVDISDGTRFQADADDVRMVYQTTAGQTDLGRYVDGLALLDIDIYFPVQATIPANEDIGGESDYKYYMYYDYPSAGSPGTYTNVNCIDAPYSTDANTVALWHFEEWVGDALDETANNNDATRVGASFIAGGKFGRQMLFDGTNDYAWVDWYVADPPSAAMTIDFWVKVDRDSQIIMEFNETHTPSGTDDRAFSMGNDSKVRWRVYDGASYVTTSTTVLSTGTYYHVAGVIDESIGSDSGLILYINGSPEDTTFGADGGYMGYSTVEFLMGLGAPGQGFPYNTRTHFDGHIDEIRISDVTRTNFYHVDSEATLTLGVEETEGVSPRRKKILLIGQ